MLQLAQITVPHSHHATFVPFQVIFCCLSFKSLLVKPPQPLRPNLVIPTKPFFTHSNRAYFFHFVTSLSGTYFLLNLLLSLLDCELYKGKSMYYLVLSAQCLFNNRLSNDILSFPGPQWSGINKVYQFNNFAHTVMQFIFLKLAMIQSYKNEIFAQ